MRRMRNFTSGGIVFRPDRRVRRETARHPPRNRLSRYPPKT
jgi:hypothetical protein